MQNFKVKVESEIQYERYDYLHQSAETLLELSEAAPARMTRERREKVIKAKPHEFGADRRQCAPAAEDARVAEWRCGVFATFSCSSR